MGPNTEKIAHLPHPARAGSHRSLFFTFLPLLLALTMNSGLFAAAQFEPVNALYFTRLFGAPDPLPQVVDIASTGAAFGFAVAATASNGGTWLSSSPAGDCCVTPEGVSVIITTSPAMAVGIYTGQVVFSSGGIPSITVPVTFVIAPATAAFFDNMPGQVSFSAAPGGQPPSQVLQVRNAGAGTLNWNLTASTFNSGGWLAVSATSGTAPTTITVSVHAQNLPGGGATAGTYGGMLLFQSADLSSSITVPIGVTVATNAMPQVNALSFTKPFTGKNPLPQTVTIASLGVAFGFSISTYTATGSSGGTWLSANLTGDCCVSPEAVTISVAPAVTLAAGTYTGEVMASNSSQVMVIPATLTVAPATVDFLDNFAGQLSFFLSTAASNPPPSQLIQIRNAGTGTLNWTVTPATFDSGNWLTVSELNGTAPAQISIGITVANLPNAGLTAGVFTANLLFQSDNSSVTVPITVRVGSGFAQVNGINFTMLQAGPDPLPQEINVVSLGAAVGFEVSYYTATGGSWLTTSLTGDCCATPETVEVGGTAPPTMPAGVYTGEVVVFSGGTGASMTVPVTLTVVPTGSTSYFDNLPGELSFSMQTSAPQGPSPQVFQIRNAGSGTLNWTLTPTTADGGAWLTVSAQNGTAPELITVGIVPNNLPNAGLVAGVFVGQLLLQAGGSSTTIPVLVDVASNVYQQINGVNFTMLQQGANPLPQMLTVNTTGTAVGFAVEASTATGGNWLSVSPLGDCCATSEAVTVAIAAPATLPPGIYTGQVRIYGGALPSEVVPVTLTVAPSNTPFFDNVPGGLNYSLPVGGGNPAPQNVQIRNFGTGTLSWTAQTATADGANWLTVSAASGTAPSLISVGIVTQKLPNAGLVAGLFTGQVLFLSANSSVTIPISVQVGGTIGFLQTNGLSFTMPFNGANPLPQILTMASSGTATGFSVTAYTGNGGSWMTAAPLGDCCATPETSTVAVSAPPALAAGTYTAEVVFNRVGAVQVVPVSLTVAPSTVPFFDNVQGQMGFFAAVSATPASQTLYLQGLGPSALGWTVTPMTADNGNWLVPSIATGTAPSNITVSIDTQNLPNQGLVAGHFTGQLLFQSASSSVTVPVSVLLGPNTFTQTAGLNFSMAYAGANPLSQVLDITSTGSAIGYAVTTSSGNGGNWLSTLQNGDCCATPENITFNVNGDPGTQTRVPVPAGIHIGQTVFNAVTSAMTVPVILTVNGTPVWNISKTHTGNFTAGQNNATYTVTVSNQSAPSVGLTSGTVTVTDTVPNGMTLVSMAGDGWTCPAQGKSCTRSDSISSGESYASITVTVNVVTTSQTSLTNQVSVSGGGAASAASASDQTAIITKCDVDQAPVITAVEVQSLINQLLGLVKAANDLNGDGVINVVDVQLVVNAALGNGCQ
jgi:uncharacterized repeat protein (TIGR01451 family)